MPGTWRRAGSPCTDAPWPTTTLLRLGLEDPVLPARRVGRPCRRVLPVQQHDVEVFGVGQAAELVELLLRVDAVAGRHLRHQLVAVARDALQGDAEHLVHLAVRFGGLEEADAAVVGVAHQPREPLLPEFALHLAADGACAERQPGDFDSGSAERDQIGRIPALGAEREGSGHGQRSRGKSGLQEFASSEMRHLLSFSVLELPEWYLRT